MKRFTLPFIGAAAGFVNGFFGSGGGSVVVPSLEKFADVAAKKAHATAVAVILPMSLVSAFMYVRGGGADWSSVLWVSAGGTIGGVIGARVLAKIKPKFLHKIFGLFMLAAGLRSFW